MINPWADTLFMSTRLDFLHTGSRVICNPPTNTDDDYLYLCRLDRIPQYEEYLAEQDFIRGGSAHPGGLSEDLYSSDEFLASHAFSSWKNVPWAPIGCLNIILTASPEYFLNFKLATALAKRLNLTSKADRVTLFQAITRDSWPLETLDEVPS